MMEIQALCGCRCCDYNCEQAVIRHRRYEIDKMILQWRVPPEDREAYKKELWAHPDLLDCMLIISRLKKIRAYGSEY